MASETEDRDDVFALKQIIQKRREFNFETHIDFIKAFNRLNREQFSEIVTRTGYPIHLIKSARSH